MKEKKDHIELETKLLEVSASDISRKLEVLGAQKILDCVTYIEGFDFTPNDEDKNIFRKIDKNKFDVIFSAIADISTGSDTLISHNAYLRLREEGSRCELILKQGTKKSSSQVKSEKEISVPIEKKDWDKTRKLLSDRGLERILIQEKKRTSFLYSPLGVRFDIDTWPKIPTYLEVEGTDINNIAKALELVDLNIESGTSMTGKQIFEKYQVDPTYLVFNNES